MIEAIKIEFEGGRDAPRHEYQLGPGPCGRTVTRLDVEYGDSTVFVHQYVEGERDGATFVYPLARVHRVAVYRYNPNVCALPPRTED